MGITAVSTASLSATGKGAAPQLSADGAGAGADFAALLTQQLTDPQLLEMQLQSVFGSPGGQEANALGESAEDEDSTGQDSSALLGLAALLPGLADTAKAPQPAADSASTKSDEGTSKEQITGIVGQLGNRAASDNRKDVSLGAASQQDATAALATETMGKETAIIAGESESGSGGGQNFAATLAAHSAQAQRAQSASENSAATVRTPITDGRWSQDFGEKVVWLAKNDQQMAQLNINPPQLGPMHITLNLSGDQASALFVSAHAEVRQAIHEALPQLREMLANAGINLGQANVGTQLPQQNNGTQPQFLAPSHTGGDNAILRAENGQGTSAPLTAVHAGRGMVDLFA